MLGGDKDNNGNLIVLKIKDTVVDESGNDKKVAPYFTVSRKGESGKFEVVGSETRVSGVLKEISVQEKEFKNPKNNKTEKRNEVKIKLVDSSVDELYLIDLRLNILARQLLNSLLGVPKGEHVSLSLYEKDGWGRVAVRANGELTNWKYDAKDIPKPKEIKDDEGEVIKKDYKKVDALFIDGINEWKELAETTSSSEEDDDDDVQVEETPKAKRGRKKAEPAEEEKGDDDVPF